MCNTNFSNSWSRIWQYVSTSSNNAWPWMAISYLSFVNVLHLSNCLSLSSKDFELVLEPLSMFSSLLQLPLLQPHHCWLEPWVPKKH
jgi:hypothetical protein